MASKKNKYIYAELDWLENKLKEWAQYVDSHPFPEIKDRWGEKMTKSGGVTHVIAATKEQQQAALRATIKDIYDLLPRINELREQEEKENIMQTRGDVDVPDIMK